MIIDLHEARTAFCHDEFIRAQRAYDAFPCKSLALELEDAYREFLNVAYGSDEAKRAMAKFTRQLWERVA